MLINLVSLKVDWTNPDEKRFIRLSMVNNAMIKKALETGKDYFASPTYYVISIHELSLAIECLKGKSQFYPFFDDGIHKIQFKQSGVVGLDVNEPSCEYHYFTFNGLDLAFNLKQMLDTGYPFEWSKERINNIKCQFSPRVKWDFTNYDDFYKLPYTVKQSLTRNLNISRFRGGLNSLVRIAKNYSNGQYSTIHLSFDNLPKDDGRPDDYYWWIELPNGQRLMNGGLIFHPAYNQDNKPDYSKGEYSIHT